MSCEWKHGTLTMPTMALTSTSERGDHAARSRRRRVNGRDARLRRGRTAASVVEGAAAASVSGHAGETAASVIVGAASASGVPAGHAERGLPRGGRVSRVARPRHPTALSM